MKGRKKRGKQRTGEQGSRLQGGKAAYKVCVSIYMHVNVLCMYTCLFVNARSERARHTRVKETGKKKP